MESLFTSAAFAQIPGQMALDTDTAIVAVGQVWRQEDGYLCKVMAINAKGWPYVRHVNAKQGGHLVNPAWFSTEHWTLVRDV